MATLLLVEDDPTNARVLSRILEKRGGYTVQHCEDVATILSVCASGAIALVLLDISLAHSTYQGRQLNGIEIAQLLRQNPQTARLPIVLLTAHAMIGDRDQFLQASQADAYIVKPVLDYDAFLQLIQQLQAVPRSV